MPRRALVSRLLLLIVSLAVVAPAIQPALSRTVVVAETIAPPPLDNRYIVVLRDDLVGVAAVASEFTVAGEGIHVSHVYESALNGFAAEIPPDRLVELATDPRVVSIEPDRRIYPQVQTLPDGANRIDADYNKLAKIDGKDGPGERVNADIAILDMGIGPHPDLNVVGGHDCTGRGFLTDNGGHGTHVAGIAGALDNGSGIVGVAPGARLWSVRVLDAYDGSWSWVICGLDWVTAHADTIEVANMSLGEPFGPDPTCESSALHRAVCRTVAAGVTVVVPAGNGAVDAHHGVPAQYKEVITVSAIADSDGKPGGFGPATSAGLDDHRADFSAWGAVVDIAGPGVDTYSTAPGGGFSVMNGTSFATPHVAAAAALYIAKHGRVGPAAVRAGLLAERQTGHIPGDPDGIDEGIVNVGDLKRGSLTLQKTAGKPRDVVGFTLSNFKKQSLVELRWDGIRLLAVTTDASGAASGVLTIPSTTKGTHLVQAVGDGRSASAPFTVSPLLVVSPSTGPAYRNARITLRGFGRYERITVSFSNGSNAITLATVKASRTGSAYVDVKLPAAPAGNHRIRGVGSLGNTASAIYTVKPSLGLKPTSAGPSDTFVATLRGFAPTTQVKLRWYEGATHKTLATANTTANGSRAFTVAVPDDATPGRHRVEAVDTAGHLVALTFTVQAPAATAAEQTPTSTPTVEPTQEATPEPTTTPTPESSPSAVPTDEPTEATSSPDSGTPTPTESATPEEALQSEPEPYRIVRGTQSRGADPALLVVDGDPSTIWYASATARGAYVELDLGEVIPIGEIRWFVADSAAIAGLEILVSTDRRTWVSIGIPEAGGGGTWNVLDAAGIEARYVRFAFPAAAKGVPVGGIGEIEIWRLPPGD
ncbi:MAG: in [Thermomicrobiales bacterium]|nr:in [Thermomicrobiales bacterium]